MVFSLTANKQIAYMRGILGRDLRELGRILEVFEADAARLIHEAANFKLILVLVDVGDAAVVANTTHWNAY